MSVSNIVKVCTFILVMFTLIGGLMTEVPRLDILNESIRNLFFHVPMWFGMVGVMTASLVYSLRYLKYGNVEDDIYAVELVNTGVLFGILGLATGMLWAKHTWGEYWSSDPKQNASAIAMLFYLAYLLLRASFEDEEKRGRMSAIYNIFAYFLYIPLLFVLPRLTSSLHPGNGGNPGFNAYDLDSKLRAIFYPSVIAWGLLGWWLTNLRVRYRNLLHIIEEKEFEYENK